MAHPSKMEPAEDLLHQFLDHHERSVQRGSASPFSRLERLVAKMAFEWLLEKYTVEKK